MRDTHDQMPEILDAYERGETYFGSVRVTIDDETRDLEFGVPIEDYKALRHILQTRPFDQLPGIQYRHFIAGSIGRLGENRASINIRIEQGHNGRQVTFEVPLSLARNLYWFFQLKDFKESAHLHAIDEATPKV